MTEELFTYATRGTKLTCTVCGRTGWFGGRWQDACRAGHPHRCPCGRRFANKQAIAGHWMHCDRSNGDTP